MKKVMCKNCVYCSSTCGTVCACHKNSPVPNGGDYAIWPTVNVNTDWCGEGVARVVVSEHMRPLKGVIPMQWTK